MNTTKHGKKYKFGDIVLALVQFTDSNEIKTRPALVLFEEFDNIVLMGITSNTAMKGIFLKKEEGMAFDSILKINYIFTVTEAQIKKYLFNLTEEKKEIIKKEIINHLE
jgi:mRNA interferase MazF